MGSQELFQFSQVLSTFGNRLFSFLTDRGTLAVFLCFLGYRLMRLAVDRTSSKESFDPRRFAIVTGPGAGLCLLAFLILLAAQEMFLVILLQVFALGVGSLFAFWGYRLFAGGVQETSDVEARLKDRSVVLKNFAPGTLFALFGLVMIAVALYQGFSVVSSFGSEQAEAQRTVATVVDKYAGQALALADSYLKDSRLPATDKSGQSSVPVATAPSLPTDPSGDVRHNSHADAVLGSSSGTRSAPSNSSLHQTGQSPRSNPAGER
jgi:hypothetical protein